MGDNAAPLQLVIRSAKELVLSHGQTADRAEDDSLKTQAVTEAARLFKVETIDWKTQMIIVASAGAKPSSGYAVEITGLDELNDVLIVHWRLSTFKAGDFVTESGHPSDSGSPHRAAFDGKVVLKNRPSRNPQSNKFSVKD